MVFPLATVVKTLLAPLVSYYIILKKNELEADGLPPADLFFNRVKGYRNQMYIHVLDVGKILKMKFIRSHIRYSRVVKDLV